MSRARGRSMPMGDRATLVELSDNAAVHAAARMARERYGDALEDVVAGHSTLLLVWKQGHAVSDMEALDVGCTADVSGTTGRTVTIPVMYDGADLEAVALKLGVGRETIVKLHSDAGYVVAFMGFTPGFPYLVADEGAEAARLLALPRLDTPRTEVPAGSVAVAAGYCGVYPRSSPGGWNLLGRTEAVLFDAEQQPPALLEPGMRVRFEPV